MAVHYYQKPGANIVIIRDNATTTVTMITHQDYNPAFEDPHMHTQVHEILYVKKGYLLVGVLQGNEIKWTLRTDQSPAFFIPHGVSHVVLPAPESVIVALKRGDEGEIDTKTRCQKLATLLAHVCPTTLLSMHIA